VLPARVFQTLRHEVLGAGENEGVGVTRVVVAGQTLVGLAGNLRNGHVEAVPERAIARAGVVGERKVGLKTGAPATHGHRNPDLRGARYGVGGKLLPDAADGAAALGKR
jgi:hypothetical protein